MPMLRILLVGHGRMGQLVGQLAGEYGCEVAGIVDPQSPAALRRRGRRPLAGRGGRGDRLLAAPTRWSANVPALARRGINVVIGTTGWQAHEAALRQAVARRRHRASSPRRTSRPAWCCSRRSSRARPRSSPASTDFGAWLHEGASHDEEGRAVRHRAAAEARRWRRRATPGPIDVSSTRAGYIPGTHTIGFDGPSESITLSHAARDRSAFARGALTAAQWVQGPARLVYDARRARPEVAGSGRTRPSEPEARSLKPGAG